MNNHSVEAGSFRGQPDISKRLAQGSKARDEMQKRAVALNPGAYYTDKIIDLPTIRRKRNKAKEVLSALGVTGTIFLTVACGNGGAVSPKSSPESQNPQSTSTVSEVALNKNTLIKLGLPYDKTFYYRDGPHVPEGGSGSIESAVSFGGRAECSNITGQSSVVSPGDGEVAAESNGVLAVNLGKNIDPLNPDMYVIAELRPVDNLMVKVGDKVKKGDNLAGRGGCVDTASNSGAPVRGTSSLEMILVEGKPDKSGKIVDGVEVPTARTSFDGGWTFEKDSGKMVKEGKTPREADVRNCGPDIELIKQCTGKRNDVTPGDNSIELDSNPVASSTAKPTVRPDKTPTPNIIEQLKWRKYTPSDSRRMDDYYEMQIPDNWRSLGDGEFQIGNGWTAGITYYSYYDGKVSGEGLSWDDRKELNKNDTRRRIATGKKLDPSTIDLSEENDVIIGRPVQILRSKSDTRRISLFFLPENNRTCWLNFYNIMGWQDKDAEMEIQIAKKMISTFYSHKDGHLLNPSSDSAK